MTTMTLAVENEIKQKMSSFPEINWSEVARQAFKQKINDLELFRKFKSNSTFTEEDALRLGNEVNKTISKRLKQKAK
jgi:hypothetical protein